MGVIIFFHSLWKLGGSPPANNYQEPDVAAEIRRSWPFGSLMRVMFLKPAFDRRVLTGVAWSWPISRKSLPFGVRKFGACSAMIL